MGPFLYCTLVPVPNANWENPFIHNFPRTVNGNWWRPLNTYSSGQMDTCRTFPRLDSVEWLHMRVRTIILRMWRCDTRYATSCSMALFRTHLLARGKSHSIFPLELLPNQFDGLRIAHWISSVLCLSGLRLKCSHCKTFSQHHLF